MGAVKRNGVSVTLDGHGADELLSGYGHILEALWDSKFDFKMIKDILDTYHHSMSSFLQENQKNKAEVYLKYMLKKSIKIMLGRDARSKDFQHPNYKKLDNFSQNLYIIFHETVLPTLLRNYDRYSMMNSVEIRMPFMDHRIVSFINSLPYSSKFGQGYTKKIIRDAMDPYMPKEVTWRKSKIGFNTPIVNWMQGDLKKWFGDIIHSKDFLECQLVDNPKKLQSDILKIINKKNNQFSSAEKAWVQLNPYLWEKAVIKKDYKCA